MLLMMKKMCPGLLSVSERAGQETAAACGGELPQAVTTQKVINFSSENLATSQNGHWML